VKKEHLWSALSSFITFTRLSTGRGAIEQPAKLVLWNSGTRFLATKIAPTIVRLVVITIVIHIFVMPFWGWRQYEGFSYKEVPILSEIGFTAKIPSCYDGDTCYSETLRFDGQPLPDIFRNIRIRVLGIDAPELRTAKCEIEQCLAQRAKLQIERLVGAGDGRLVSLVGCKHDKYGGRITCDIMTRGGTSVAAEMLKTGLAVSYHGKKKTHEWCDIHPSSKLTRLHVSECQWERGTGYKDFENEEIY
jgi:endonuclease YncB( thermonuclease family)